jgi:hypothetical protein
MKTFLKVLLILIAAVLVIKLLPVLLVIGGAGIGGLLLAGCLLIAAVGVLGAVGLSVAAAVMVVALVLGVALSPIWVPIAVVVGIIALMKRASGRTA